MAALINGQPADQKALVSDRGLHYGDGVFRTLAIVQGQAVDLQGQLSHLAEDARRIGIMTPLEHLHQESERLSSQQHQGVLKIILTRGSGPRGYQYDAGLQPNRYLFTYAAPPGIADRQREGVQVRLCQTRLGHQPALAGIKHLNRLEQVLARNEAGQRNYAEGLLCDLKGQLICGLQSNLFLLHKQRLLTPDLQRCGVAGRSRVRILALASDAGMQTAQLDLPLQMLEEATEVFLCNSLIGIWPVVQCDALHWPVGEFTRQLQSLLHHPVLS